MRPVPGIDFIQGKEETRTRTIKMQKKRHIHWSIKNHVLIFLFVCLVSPAEGTEDDGDLNSASQAELAAAKKKMDVTFQHNLHKPDAPGYLHDLRKDFGEAKEQCDWDE